MTNYPHTYRRGTTSTKDRSKCHRASISVEEHGFVDGVPWELREDREEDEKDREANRLKDELKMKRIASVIHVVGLASYIGAVLVACSMGREGWTILILLTVAMLCMDRS